LQCLVVVAGIFSIAIVSRYQFDERTDVWALQLAQGQSR
jgi:hypothetical protein